MTSDELLKLFRKDVADTAKPYLWSDEEIYAYMNDAYFMFVRLVGGIPDYMNDDVCLVKATSGVPYSDLHPKVLAIRNATFDDSGDVVHVVNAQDTDRLTNTDFGIIRQVRMGKQIGRVTHMVTGLQDDIVFWVNVPDRDYSVRLLVERLPLDEIKGADQEFAGVKEHHHIHFMKWMKHHAYNKQDAEVYDPNKSLVEQQKFEQYCYQAKREKDKLKHKVRVVAYGGV